MVYCLCYNLQSWLLIIHVRSLMPYKATKRDAGIGRELTFLWKEELSSNPSVISKDFPPSSSFYNFCRDLWDQSLLGVPRSLSTNNCQVVAQTLSLLLLPQSHTHHSGFLSSTESLQQSCILLCFSSREAFIPKSLLF